MAACKISLLGALLLVTSFNKVPPDQVPVAALDRPLTVVKYHYIQTRGLRFRVTLMTVRDQRGFYYLINPGSNTAIRKRIHHAASTTRMHND